MKFEVVIGTKEEFEDALSGPTGMPGRNYYRSYTKDLLADAESAGKDIVYLRSLPQAENAADYFMQVNWIEQAIKEFQKESGWDGTVRIVAENDATAEQYKVVYNMYFAGSKESRLEDGKWD